MSYVVDQILIPAFSVGCAEIITLPICTLKTNYQNTHSNSAIKTFKYMLNIVHTEYNGNYFKVFYRASLPAVTSQVFSTTSKMAIYRYLFQYSDNLMLNGAVAGFCVSLVTHPFDGIKIRDQIRTEKLLNTESNIIKNIYKGYSKTLAKTLIGGMLYFPLYDYIKSYDLPSHHSALLSSTISTCILHPFDYMKTRHCANFQWFVGYNPIKYMKGLHLNLLRIVPHFTISMTLIDVLRNCKK